MYIAILLTVWLAAWAVKTYWPASKKRYFKARLNGVEKMLWDLEFSRFQKKELREDIRREHDRIKETIDALEVQIGNPKHKKETIDELTKKKEGHEGDLKHIEAQLKALDSQIDGEGDGVQASVQAQIDGLHELRKMLKSHVKSI